MVQILENEFFDFSYIARLPKDTVKGPAGTIHPGISDKRKRIKRSRWKSDWPLYPGKSSKKLSFEEEGGGEFNVIDWI